MAEAVSIAREEVFVGREKELGWLQAFLDRALAGKGQIAFVTGEPGAGKTRLVRKFTNRALSANPELVVSLGECNAQTGEGDAYLPFKEILGLLMGDVENKLTAGAITSTGAERFKKSLLRVGEVLAEVAPTVMLFVGGPLAMAAAQAGQAILRKKGVLEQITKLSEWQKEARGEAATIDESQIFEQYTKLLTQVAATNPLVLILDDLQWADNASLNLLFHLARKIQNSKILIIGTYRPNDIAIGRDGDRHPLVPTLNEIKRYYGEIEIPLDLVEDQKEDWEKISRFVSEYLDQAYQPNTLSQEFRNLIVGRTEGNALFTVELLRDLEERRVLAQDESGVWLQTKHLELGDLPARVEAVIEERIHRLDEDLRKALAAASVEGEDFTVQVVALVRRIEEGMLLERMINDAEKRHQLVLERGIASHNGHQLYLFRFRHNLFQHHLYKSLTPLEKTILHKEVATSLEKLFQNRTDEIAVQLAHHFSRAQLPEKAYEYYLKAGDKARDAFAFEEALGHYRHALDLFPEDRSKKLQVQERIGDVYRLWGEEEKSAEEYSRALELVGPGDKTLEVRLHRKASRVAIQQGKPLAAARHIKQALKGVQEIDDPLEGARVKLAQAWLMGLEGKVDEARPLIEESLAVAQRMNAALEIAQAYDLMAMGYHMMGDLQKGMEYVVKREAVFLDTPAMAENFDMQLCIVNVHVFGPRPYAQTEQFARKMLQDAQKIGGLRATALARNFLASVLHLQGKWDEALEEIRLAFETYQQAPSDWGEALALELRSQIELARGNKQAADQDLRRALEIAHEPPASTHLKGRIYADLANLELESGDVPRAQEIVIDALAKEDEWWKGCQTCNVIFFPVAVEVALAAGKLDQAHSLQERLEKGIQGWDAGPWQASALRTRGLLSLAEGLNDEAVADLEQARQLITQKDQPYDIAHTLYHLAEGYKKRGQAEDQQKARDVLAEAIKIFRQLGANQDLERSQALAAQLS